MTVREKPSISVTVDTLGQSLESGDSCSPVALYPKSLEVPTCLPFPGVAISSLPFGDLE